MKKFKVVHAPTGEIVFEYFAEKVNAIDGLFGYSHKELEHIEITDEEKDAEMKAKLAEEFAAKVNEKLQETDWTQLLDANLTQEEKDKWVQYRASLRAAKGAAKVDPISVVIPAKP